LRIENTPETRVQNWLQNSGPDTISKEIWPSNAPKFNSLDFHVWGSVGGLSRAPSKIEDNRRNQENAAGDSLIQGPIGLTKL